MSWKGGREPFFARAVHGLFRGCGGQVEMSVPSQS